MSRSKEEENLLESIVRNPLLWTMANIVLPRSTKWNFAGEREWQKAIFLDPNRQVVVRKSAQVGITTTVLCRVLHFLHTHSAHAMYTLPRRDDVHDIVNIYLDPIIAASPHIYSSKDLGQFADLALKKLDNVRAKRFVVPGLGASLLIFMESSVEPRMIPVDFLVNDEIDKSDRDNIEIFQGRIEESNYKIDYKFSTPSIEGVGIDSYFKNSTQNYWHVRCRHCNHWNKLDWFMNFQEPSLKKPAHLGCFRCHEELTPADIIGGQWVSLGRSGPDVPSGYQLSNLLMPYSRPITRIYQQFIDARNIKNFFNLVLGLPYSTSTGSMTEEMFRDNAFIEPFRLELAKVSQQPYYIGVDQGKDLHVVVGRPDGQHFRIVFAARIPFQREGGFDESARMVERYSAIAMYDSEPNRHSARTVQSQFPAGRVWLVKYGSYDRTFSISKGEDGRPTGMVLISRTEAFDELRDAVARGVVRIWSGAERFDAVAWEIVQHCCNIKRDEVVTTHLGVEKSRVIWKSVGDDHYAHALLFCYMAWKYLSKTGFRVSAIGMTESEEQKALHAIREAEAQAIMEVMERQKQDADSGQLTHARNSLRFG